MTNIYKTINIILLTFILILVNSYVYAQPYCRIKTFSISQGLTTNHITHFDQDDNGLMWFSSVNGLWSFDGYDFTPYRDYGDFHTITTQRYLSARPNHNGGIYLTDNNRSLYLYNCRKNSFHNLSRIMQEKGINMKVLDIMPLKNGNTWLIGMRGTSPGLVRINDNTILDGKGIDIVSKKPLTDATYRAIICNNGDEIIYGKIGVYTPNRGQIYKKPVLTLIKYNNSIVWGGKGNTITVYNPTTKRTNKFSMPSGVEEVNNMVSIDKDHIACGTNIGVAIINMRTLCSKIINLQSPSSPSNHVTNLFVDSKHRLWAFTDSDGLTLIQSNLKDKTWLTAKATDIMKQTTCKFTVWLQDKNGTVWAIPRGGTFCYYDETTRTLHPYALYEQENKQYAIPTMDRIFIDNQKNLWFTGLHSFNCISFGKQNFKKINGRMFGNVRSVLVDHNKNIWTGNELGNLMVYDYKNNLKGYVTALGKITSSPVVFSPNIYSLFEDSKGRIWIGTKDNGVYLLKGDGSVKNYRNDKNNKFSLSHNRANAFLQDKKGRIWIGTYGGGINLVDERDGGIRFINSNNILGKEPIAEDYAIRRLSTTHSGAIIASTTHGVITFSDSFKSPRDIVYHYLQNTSNKKDKDFPDVIQTIVMKSGKIFMATISGEIFEIDNKTLLSAPKAKYITHESVSDGPINGMFEDKAGNLWVVRENNIDKYNPQTGKNLTFWPGKVSNYSDFTEAQPQLIESTGYAIVGAQDGYITFNPDKLTATSVMPKIVFMSTLINGNKKSTPVLYRDMIELPSNKHSFTVSFAALDYSEQQFIKYAYKLEGIDKQWNNIGYNHSVSFNDLPAGKYKLLVRSTNADGQWTNNIASITIYATPAWWDTWLAKAIYFIMICVFLYFIYKYYNIRHKAAIEKIISERKTLFYREASHKLRTPLTLIGGPIVEVLKSRNISDSEREYLETARNSSRSMLKIVDSMLNDNMEGCFFVDDKNAPVFANENKEEQYDANSTDTRILVVEDNCDLRKFLVSLLSPTYTVLTASNGKEGFDMATNEQPDFILSDVTMPIMDGLTMVSLIKKNPNICHIPIVILSARASIEDKVLGIEQGIDDYITKPFSARYLKQRMAEIIAHRHVEQQTSAEEIQKSPNGEYRLSSIKIVDYDREMMSRLMDFLENHISDCNLRIEDMASAVNLGRTVFFNKVKSIVGMSPIDFLRDLRIKRACEMITSSKLTISEISAAVGFNDQRYFSRVFKKETGMTPSEYRENGKK